MGITQGYGTHFYGPKAGQPRTEAEARSRGRRLNRQKAQEKLRQNIQIYNQRTKGGTGSGGDSYRQLGNTIQQQARNLRGGSGGSGGSLASEYQKALDKANAANDKRYQQTLGLRRGMERLNLKRTGQEVDDAEQRGNVQQSAMQQQLVTGGLANTTVGIGRNTPIQRNTDAEVRRIRDDRLNTQLGLIEGRTGVIERKQDIGPDFNQLFAQQQALGQGGGGVMYAGAGAYGQRRGGFGRRYQNRRPTAAGRQSGGGTGFVEGWSNAGSAAAGGNQRWSQRGLAGRTAARNTARTARNAATQRRTSITRSGY